MLIVEKNMAGATGNLYCGLHEFEDMSFLLHFLRKEDLFLDVGANIGSYTILASGQIGCKTMAYEPVPTTFDRLKNNIAINHIDDKVEAFNVGIGSFSSKIRFTIDKDSENHVMLEHENSPSVEIAIEPLDHILGQNYPILIKIDVEGYETEVLKGARDLLQSSGLQAIIIELNGSGRKYGYSDNDIHQSLLDQGFQSVEYLPFERRLNERATYGDMNTIYVKNKNLVSERLVGSKGYTLFGEHI